ncbi:LysR family transcriptional regulator [Vibrio parahaemolyticus]|nr:LysR family transcriptional regulator [Vibrio parahaemolyticus]
MKKFIDLNLINTFLVVSESQSYTKAAAQLGVTQPAISASIKRLEQASNKKLFIKCGRGVELTHAAQELMPQLRQALDLIDNVIVKPDLFKAYWCDIPLANFSSIPNVMFHESTQNADELCEQLYNRKVDIVLGSINSKHRSIVVEKLYQDPFVIIFRKGHPRLKDTLNLDAFYNEKHCVLSSSWDIETEVENALNIIVKTSQIESISPSYLGMLINVSQRDCVGVVPYSLAKMWSKVLGIRYFNNPFSDNQYVFGMAYHKRHVNCIEHRVMREFIKNQFSINL